MKDENRALHLPLGRVIRATTSASNIFRRQLCPGSERLEAGLPEDENSPQSREGTFLHGYDANPKLERAVLKPNQQDLLRIQAGLDEWIFERVAEQFGVAAGEPFTEWREQELLALEGGPNETPGHCDRAWYLPRLKLLVIRDAKFGYKEVTPAAANYQLRVYAIGGYAVTDAENVVVAITQPRLAFERRVTLASYTREDIEAAKVELTAIRSRSREPDAPLVAGEEQCRYCKAKAKCPAFTAQLVPLDPGKTGKELLNTLDALTPEQRDGLLRAVRFADFIKDALLDHERQVIAVGGESLYELGKESMIRSVADTKRAVAYLTLRGDVTKDQALECCEMHIGALEERVRKNRKCTWKETREIVEAALASVLERKPKARAVTRKKEGKLLTR